MLLAIDVGNSNTVMGLFQLASDSGPASLIADWRITTPHKQTPDELAVLLQTLFAMRHIKMDDVNGVAIASVVPPLDASLRRVCELCFKVRPLFVEPGVKTGLPVLTDNPGEVGADRVVNCVAAFDLVLVVRPEVRHRGLDRDRMKVERGGAGIRVSTVRAR